MSVEHIWKQKQVVFGKNSIDEALKKNIVTELRCSVTELLNTG